MMSAPNMDNKLGLLWRKNVLMLLAHCNMKASDLSKFTNRSESTLQACFGGTGKTIKSLSSVSTITQIETGFNLKSGALSSPNFNPVTESIKVEPPLTHPEQLASINIPIPADKLQQIMRILLE